uniref:Cytochrome P450 1A n=1 Tax=Spermophilus dauricus TaxID=99837 RepID=A0A8C9USD5_SPEDA
MLSGGLPLSISAAELLLAAAIFCLIFWVVRASRPRVPKGLKSPPGPWGWPLIGHMLTLGKNPQVALAKLSQKYGDVLQIRIGTTPVVVLSGLDTIHQALVRQGDDFKGRPDLYTFTFVTDGKSMTFSPDSGPVWAARRRLAQSALKSFSIASDPTSASSCYLEEHVSKEAECLISKFQELMADVGHFDPYRYVVVSVANVICAICFGQRYDHNNQELLDLVDLNNEFGEVAASGYPADFIPILRYLPNPTLDGFKDLNKKFEHFIGKLVKEHYRKFEKGHIRDITDSLIEHCQDRKLDENANIQLSDEKIINVVLDIFGAGFDTVTTAISWGLMYLVTNPRIQRKIQEELGRWSGKPFSTSRPLHPPFRIPGPMKLWGDPSVFRPERFITSSGTVDKTLSEKVILFGLGKRKCIGETIARLEIFLFMAILMQQLEFSVSPGMKVDMTPIYGLTVKHPRCEHFQAHFCYWGLNLTVFQLLLNCGAIELKRAETENSVAWAAAFLSPVPSLLCPRVWQDSLGPEQ